MHESTPRRGPQFSRRSALVTAAAAALAALSHSPTSIEAATPPTRAAERYTTFTETLPLDWQRWRNVGFGTTLGDLLIQMMIETEVVTTLLPELDFEEQIEKNRLVRLELANVPDELEKIAVERNAVSTDLALALGFALGMTRDATPNGPGAGYQAALKYASIVVRSKDDLKGAYGRLQDEIDENYRLLGYVRIAPTKGEPS